MADESGISECGYSLVISFTDQSPSFCHGFEAGGLWEQMKRGDVAEIEAATVTDNREVIARIAGHLGWSIVVTPSEVQGWDLTKLTKTSPAGRRDNPHGLRVVT